MTDGPFQISIADDRSVVRVRLSGFWTLGTVSAFQQEAMAAMKRAGTVNRDATELRLLIDATSMLPQGQDVLASMLDAFADARDGVVRSAMVVGSALLRLQVRRVSGERHRFFENGEEAFAWLTS